MPLYVLDTDILTLLRFKHPLVSRRVSAISPSDLAVTVITVEEVLTGWYNIARTANQPNAIEHAYHRHLCDAVTFFTGITVLNFTLPAISISDSLKSQKLNVKKNDLR